MDEHNYFLLSQISPKMDDQVGAMSHGFVQNNKKEQFTLF